MEFTLCMVHTFLLEYLKDWKTVSEVLIISPQLTNLYTFSTNPRQAISDWPWWRNADAGLRQLTKGRNAVAGPTFPGIPAFTYDISTSYSKNKSHQQPFTVDTGRRVALNPNPGQRSERKPKRTTVPSGTYVHRTGNLQKEINQLIQTALLKANNRHITVFSRR